MLYQKYKTEVVPLLLKEFRYDSIMQVPRIEKIVVNAGLGDAAHDRKVLENGAQELHLITGQKPIITKAKKSISAFKVRQNQGIGCKVTLRKNRMWQFLSKMIMVVIPRIRDFRGLPLSAFDGRGSYTFGIKEQIIFPEIVYDNIKRVRGFNISIITSAFTNKEAFFLLKYLGMPFIRKEEVFA